MTVKSCSTVLLAGVAAAALAACSNSNRRESLAYIEKPVEQLYNEAAESIDKRLWDQAALQFNEVQRQHPYSEWAQRSMLMASYAHYRGRDYDESVQAAEQYIALFPGGQGAAYAYYLIGVSHFEQIIDVGREQGRTNLALAGLTEVVRRFPQTEYARDAELKVDMVRDQLAGKEMQIGRYYLRTSEHLSAINRFKTVVDQYDTTTHTPEALHRLVEAYLSIGLDGQALAAASVLGHNYPGSEWYADTYELMTSKGVVPETAPEGDDGGWFSGMWNSIF
ncbi:MAG: outer membrane protein assembly factor BamD [Pseudomonadota bacterium]